MKTLRSIWFNSQSGKNLKTVWLTNSWPKCFEVKSHCRKSPKKCVYGQKLTKRDYRLVHNLHVHHNFGVFFTIPLGPKVGPTN